MDTMVTSMEASGGTIQALAPAAQDSNGLQKQMLKMDAGGTEIAGELTVSGAGAVPATRLEVQRNDDGTVSGVLLDTENNVVGNFTGRMSGTHAWGAFTLPSGYEGSWSWNSVVDQMTDTASGNGPSPP